MIESRRLHDAARYAGQRMAEGAATWEQTRLLCRELAKEAPQTDQIGAAIRLCWSAMGAAGDYSRAVWQAEDRVSQAVRPLMERGASKAEIEEAAGQAADGAIEWDRIFSVLRDEVAQFKHKSRWRR